MERITHDLQQGTPEWHQFRAQHHGASEASAMLGLSPYKGRTELLREKKTGITQDVDAATQRIFDRGHEIESLARPMAEALIVEDLFPVTMSYGNLSASCDGLTFDETIAWECKSSNKADFEIVQNGGLPEKHWPQCQQVMLVTGADRLLFTISDGTEEGTAHTWVNADAELQQRIIDGWQQFSRDLETFEPEPEVIKAQATLVDDLLLPSIVVTGQIAVESNLELFGEVLHDFIGRINVKPQTDEDFVNIGKAIKSLEKAEEWLDKQEEGVISKFDQLNQTIALKNTLKELARENRLMLQKIDKAEKENRKAQIVAAARNDLFEHQQRIQSELPVTFTHQAVNFADAIKGKKTISSMQDAVNTMLANAKIEADALARDLREKHVWYIENAGEYSFLFSDLSALIYKDSDSFQAVCRNRIMTHQEQEKAKAEAAEKAQAEREKRIAAEAAEKAAKAERERIAAEQAANKMAEEQAKSDQAYREKLELLNQEELERAAQKANPEKAHIEVAKNTPIEQVPVFNQEIQDQSKAIEIIPGVVVDKVIEGFKPAQQSPGVTYLPNRDQIIGAIAAKFSLTKDEALQAIAKAFYVHEESEVA
jgi:putative phage-type endonuclease